MGTASGDTNSCIQEPLLSTNTALPQKASWKALTTSSSHPGLLYCSGVLQDLSKHVSLPVSSTSSHHKEDFAHVKPRVQAQSPHPTKVCDFARPGAGCRSRVQPQQPPLGPAPTPQAELGPTPTRGYR